MRRFILFIAVLFLIIGGQLQYMKVHTIFSEAPVSENEIKLNNCTQQLMAFSMSLFFGLPFLFMPVKAVEWFIEPLSSKSKKYILKGFNFGGLRLFGFMLVLSVCLAIPSSSCLDVLRYLFGR